MRFNARLRRLTRQNKTVVASDPEGLMATLQVTKRLLSESVDGEHLTIMEAVDKAIPMAAAKDSVRTWWAAMRVIFRHTEADKSSLAILSDAIAAQGKTNRFANYGPQA